jgi:L-fucose isomerase-like protein
VLLDEHASKLGAVETSRHAKAVPICSVATATASWRPRCLPNFGDEKGVADALKVAALDVPVLVQAYLDDLKELHVACRRDAFCGKISVCNNLRQAAFVIALPTRIPSMSRRTSLRASCLLLSVCRVVRGMRRARIGAIGARLERVKHPLQ